MTTENKKNFRLIILCFTGVCLLVLGSMMIKFNLIDLIYLLFVLTVLARYIYIKKSE